MIETIPHFTTHTQLHLRPLSKRQKQKESNVNLKWGFDKIDWWLIIGLEKQRTKLMFVLSESLIKNSLFRLRKHLLCSTTGSSSSPSVLNDYPRIRQQPFSQEKECIIIDDTGIKNDLNVLLDWQCHFDQPLCALTVVKIINILIAIIVVILSPSQVPRLTCLWRWVGGWGARHPKWRPGLADWLKEGQSQDVRRRGPGPASHRWRKLFSWKFSFFQIKTSRRWRGGPTQPQCCPSPLL